MKFLRHGLRLLALFLLLPSCASVSAPHLRTDRTLVNTDPVVLRSRGSAVLQRAEWNGDHLRATIKQEVFCRDAVRDVARYQRVEVRTSHLVALDITLGALLTAGGVALLGVTPLIPDQPIIQPTDGSDPISSHVFSILGGVTLAGTGIGILSFGIAKGVQSRDRLSGPPWIAEENHDIGAQRSCGTGPAPRGSIQLAFGDTTMKRIPLDDGGVALDLGQFRHSLCADEKHIGTPLSVTFVPASGSLLPIASHSMDNCIRAELASKLIDEARLEVQTGQSTVALAHVELLQRQAASFIVALPKGKEVEELSRRAEEVRINAGHASQQLLLSAIEDVRQRLEKSGPEGALRLAVETLALSRNVQGQVRTTMTQIYGAFVQAALASGEVGLGAVQKLLQEDGPTRACLEGGGGCPPELDKEAVVPILRPFGDRLAQDLQHSRATIEASTTQLRRRVSESAYETASNALSAAQGRIRIFCGNSPFAGVKAECATLANVADAAKDTIEGSQARLRQQRLTHTLARWRQYFGRCRKINATIYQLRAVSHCDARCQLILQRVRADRDALEDIEIDGEIDDDSRGKLQTECERAGCPTCP